MASIWPNKFFAKWRYRLSFFLPKEKSQKSYIIPTTFGFLYGLLCLALLYIAFASANNLLYFYTFFLSGLGFSCIWFTHANVSELIIEDVEVDDVFAGDNAYAVVTISNPGKSSRYQIQVYHRKKEVSIISEIPPRSSRTVRILLGQFRRGRQDIPRIAIASTFPFFLLTTWKKFDLKKNFFVFPKRAGQTHFPQVATVKENAEGVPVDSVRSADSEFSGHRKYETSDSPRHIDWKAFARTDRLLVKDYQGFHPHEVKIQWHQTMALRNFEDRLSQMAMWVEIAEMKGFHYSFDLGPLAIMTGRGRAHYLQCLQYLADAHQEGLT